MKFLVFQHVPHEHPGMLADAARKKGIELEIIEFWKPYQIPQADGYKALIIMGGPMGVYEDKNHYPSKEDELTFIKAHIGKLPMIGFCLGSQLLAAALGAKVYPNIREGRKIKEVGFYDVELTVEGLSDSLFESFDSPMKVLQWHGDAFDLPAGATLLATSPACRNQAFRYGSNIYGTLFHNEFTPEMIEKQIETDRAWIHADFTIDESELNSHARDYSQLMRSQCDRLFTNFCHIAKIS